MKSRGFLLLEVLIAVAILFVTVGWLVRAQMSLEVQQCDMAIGHELSIMASAIKQYMQIHREALILGRPIILPSGQPIQNPMMPSISELQALGLLLGSWSTWNGLNHRGWFFHIWRSDLCTERACHLYAVVWIPTRYDASLRMLSVIRVIHILQGIHGDVGIYVDPFSPQEMRNVNGAIRLPNRFGLHDVAGVFVGASHTEIYLRRTGLFPMLGDLDMDDHAIHGVNQIHSSGVLTVRSDAGKMTCQDTEIFAADFVPHTVQYGHPCHSPGAFARDEHDQPMVCHQNTWHDLLPSAIQGLRALFMPYHGQTFFCQDPHSHVIVDVLINELGMPALRVRGYTDWQVGVQTTVNTPSGLLQFSLTPAGIHVNGSGVPVCYFPLYK